MAAGLGKIPWVVEVQCVARVARGADLDLVGRESGREGCVPCRDGSRFGENTLGG